MEKGFRELKIIINGTIFTIGGAKYHPIQYTVNSLRIDIHSNWYDEHKSIEHGLCCQNKGIKCFQQTSNQTNKFATNIIWHRTPQFSTFTYRFVNRAHNYNRIRFVNAFHLSDWIGINVGFVFFFSLLFLAAILRFSHLVKYVRYLRFIFIPFYCSLFVCCCFFFLIASMTNSLDFSESAYCTTYIERIYGWDHL